MFYDFFLRFLLSDGGVRWMLCFKFLHKSSIIEFLYSVPISIVNVFIGPYYRIQFSNKALAKVFGLLSGIFFVTDILLSRRLM